MSKKSNLPEFKEIMGFAGKFMRDMKSSVSEIIEEYQTSRKQASKPHEKKSSEKTKTHAAKPAPKAKSKPLVKETPKDKDSKKTK